MSALFRLMFLLAIAAGVSVAEAAPIHDAVRKGMNDKVRSMLGRDRSLAALPLKDGTTPLHVAALSTNAEAARYLIIYGAVLDARNKDGAAALHFAAARDALTVARVLVENGASVDAATESGMTPLHWAALGNAGQVTAYLAKKGANVNAQAKNGMTPLHVAARKNALEAMDVLLTSNADLYIKAADGNTAAYWVKSSEGRAILEKAVLKKGDSAPTTAQTPSPAVSKVVEGARTVDEVAQTSVRKGRGGAEVTVLWLPDGSRYEGQVVEGKPHGTGTRAFKGNERYRGEWRMGRREGKGTYYFPDGERYDGQWLADRMNGYGIYSFRNGGRIEGTWKNSRLVSGIGLYEFEDGDKYDGEWANNKMNGQGVYTVNGGGVFRGAFVDNVFAPSGNTTSRPRPEAVTEPAPRRTVAPDLQLASEPESDPETSDSEEPIVEDITAEQMLDDMLDVN